MEFGLLDLHGFVYGSEGRSGGSIEGFSTEDEMPGKEVGYEADFNSTQYMEFLVQPGLNMIYGVGYADRNSGSPIKVPFMPLIKVGRSPLLLNFPVEAEEIRFKYNSGIIHVLSYEPLPKTEIVEILMPVVEKNIKDVFTCLAKDKHLLKKLDNKAFVQVNESIRRISKSLKSKRGFFWTLTGKENLRDVARRVLSGELEQMTVNQECALEIASDPENYQYYFIDEATKVVDEIDAMRNNIQNMDARKIAKITFPGGKEVLQEIYLKYIEENIPFL